MKFLVLLALVAFVAASPANDYSRYDNFNVDEVIQNDRLMLAHVNCFLGTGKCTPEGSDIKEWIPDAVQTSCGKCSDKQKTLVARVIKAITEKYPKEWEKLNAIHNPDGKYNDSLKEFLDTFGN